MMLCAFSFGMTWTNTGREASSTRTTRTPHPPIPFMNVDGRTPLTDCARLASQ
jgi:hypothetical protein